MSRPEWASLTGPLPPRSRAFLALLFSMAAALPGNAQDMRPISASLAARLDATGRKAVAVIDFTDLQGNVTELGRFLAEELSVALVSDAKSFAVVDRTHLKALLRENKLASTGLIDPQTARQLGKIAGVDVLLTGTLTAFGDSVRLAVKALDTETARILGAATAEIAKTKVIEELLGKGVGEALGAPSSAAGPTAGSPRRATPTTASGTTGTSFANDFLAVTARSAGVAYNRNQWNASVALTIENISQEEQLLAYAMNSAGLSDAQARGWRVSAVSGLPMTYSNPPNRQEFARLPPGGKQTVILTFEANGDAEAARPSQLAISMMCWRLKGSTPERVSIGLPEIPVSK
jgi:TolB-like protein